MNFSSRDITVSWLFVFVAGVALWPPGAVYWEAVAAVIGNALTLAVVGVAAGTLAALFVWKTEIGLLPYTLGSVLAYACWIVGIERTMTPDSPVHFIWYGGLLGCFLAGATLWKARTGQTDLLRSPSE
jgi:hypothetical protein